jgi:pimeloyl-ACP methyl ester carboxylesterase
MRRLIRTHRNSRENTLATQKTATRRTLRWLIRILVTVVVLALLSGIAFYFRPLMVLQALDRISTSLLMLREGIHSRYVQLGPYNIHYLAAGEGRPLVCVHGMGGRAENWIGWIQRFRANGFRVYALDLLGYGRSDRPDVDYSPSLQSGILRQFLDSQGLRQSDVAGMSMGGGICLGLAADSPERVSRLILLDSAGLKFDVDFTLLRPQTIEQMRRLVGPVPAFIARDLIREFDQDWVDGRAIDSAPGDFLDGKLGKVNMPVFIAWGKQDGLIPLSVGKAMHREIPQSIFFVAEGCGHDAAFTCLDKIAPEVERFLATTTRANAFAADSPFDGTWKIDLATAQFPAKPSANAPTFTFKSTPDGLVYSDSSSGESFDVRFDGKEYPVKGGRGGVISVIKLNDRSIVQTVRRDGKVVRVYHMTVSADGKTASLKTENKEQGTTTTVTAIKQ